MPMIRSAALADLPQLITLLADDSLGSSRDSFCRPLPDCYLRAFRRIADDPDNTILVLCEDSAPDQVLGFLQITITQYLSHRGSIRATIENVRIRRDLRGKGLGTALLQHSIAYARAQGASIIQLTTDKTRTDAHRFYERLGFRATHEGMKLPVQGSVLSP